MPGARRLSCFLLALVALVPAQLVAASSAQAAFPGADGELVYQDRGIIRAEWSADGALTEHRLTRGTDRNPRWLQDGRRIVFNDTAGRVWLMDASGRNRVLVLAGGAYQPAPSPRLADGVTKIAVVRVPVGGTGSIWTVRASGEGARQLTRPPATSCGDSWPTWSPDGRHLAWVHTDLFPTGLCGPSHVVVLDRWTGSRTVVDTATDPGSSVVREPRAGRLSFSSDGTTLYFPTEQVSCFEYWGAYDVRSGEATLVAPYSCGARADVRELVPTPGGGFLTTTSLNRSDGTAWSCLEWAGGEACRPEDDFRPPFPFQGVDVQPVRR